MATVHFKPTLVNTAISLIETESTFDKLKAKDDIYQIDSILYCYRNGYRYDVTATIELDRRIRQEHPVIESIDRLPPSGASRAPKSSLVSRAVPMVIRNLEQDRFGIMFDILLKEKLVRNLNDFVDWIE